MNQFFHKSPSFYYLGIEKTATQEEIDKAYLKKFRSINHFQGNIKKDVEECLEAYETLIDEDLRKKYDKHVEVGEIVRNVTDIKSDQINEGAAPFSGKSKRSEEDERFSSDQLQYFWKLARALLVIVLFPKVLYIAYIEMRTL